MYSNIRKDECQQFLKIHAESNFREICDMDIIVGKEPTINEQNLRNMI